VHLVGFIIGIYRDARSPERQISFSYFHIYSHDVGFSTDRKIFPFWKFRWSVVERFICRGQLRGNLVWVYWQH